MGLTAQPSEIKQSIRELVRINRIKREDVPMYVKRFMKKYDVRTVSEQTLLREAMKEFEASEQHG